MFFAHDIAVRLGIPTGAVIVIMLILRKRLKELRAGYEHSRTVFLTAALARAMIAKGSGSIINITTMAAYFGVPGTSAYGATKGALSSLTRTWAAEFSTVGVRVNTVSPGPTRTNSLVAAMGEAGAEQVGKTTLFRRLAAPREIAEVILFLASDRSTYITSATIAVDAGRTAI